MECEFSIKHVITNRYVKSLFKNILFMYMKPYIGHSIYIQYIYIPVWNSKISEEKRCSNAHMVNLPSMQRK